MIKYFARRKALRQLAEFTPREAAHVLRFVIGSEVPVDPAIMLMLAERAIEGASGPGRTVLERFAEAYRAGRQVKFGTGTTLLEGETPALVADVESAFVSSKEKNHD
jgi:hypothetical protein